MTAVSGIHSRPGVVNRRRCAWAAAVCLSAAFVSSCGGPGADQAGEVAKSFTELATSNPDQACDLLSGHTREQVEKQSKMSCADALKDEDVPDPSDVRSVDVYGHDARVVLGNDTMFLALFPEGWKVTAASCRMGPGPDAPYDCDVSGV